MSEIMKLNSIHVRKFDFDPHFHDKIYYDNKHRMIKIFNLQGILILNITILLQDNNWLPTIESVCVCVCVCVCVTIVFE